MLRSVLFMLPIAFFGIGTILAAQEALGFPDAMRHALNFLLLAFMLLAEDRYGPSAVRRERGSRR